MVKLNELPYNVTHSSALFYPFFYHQSQAVLCIMLVLSTVVELNETERINKWAREYLCMVTY